MNKIFNLPNILSMARIALTPIFVFFFFGNLQSQIFAIFIFSIAAITDSCDGYFARKNQTQTKFGAFIDPLADKCLILSAFSIFAYQKTISWWIVIILIVRDVIVTQIRIRSIKYGYPFQTSINAKLKTILQFIGIYFLFLGSLLHNILNPKQLWYFNICINTTICLFLFFSIYTCIDYCIKYIKNIIKIDKK